MTDIYNIAETKPIRRRLRRAQTPAEAILWTRLRNQQVSGLKFRRQFGIGYYVTDFFNPESKTAIEIDGYSHTFEETWRSDVIRQQYFESLGILVLRFSNEEVMRETDSVVLQIAVEAEECTRYGRQETSPQPSPWKGEGAG